MFTNIKDLHVPQIDCLLTGHRLEFPAMVNPKHPNLFTQFLKPWYYEKGSLKLAKNILNPCFFINQKY